jgi:hypothetical protein
MRVKASKLLIMATIIAAGFLALSIAANSSFATSIELQQTIASGASSMTQSSTQTSSGLPRTQTSSSHNQLVVGSNPGNTASTASGSDPSGGGSSGATSGISQSNVQNAFCIAGTSNSGSCNQAASNFNFGNAVSAAIASFGAR